MTIESVRPDSSSVHSNDAPAAAAAAAPAPSHDALLSGTATGLHSSASYVAAAAGSPSPSPALTAYTYESEPSCISDIDQLSLDDWGNERPRQRRTSSSRGGDYSDRDDGEDGEEDDDDKSQYTNRGGPSLSELNLGILSARMDQSWSRSGATTPIGTSGRLERTTSTSATGRSSAGVRKLAWGAADETESPGSGPGAGGRRENGAQGAGEGEEREGEGDDTDAVINGDAEDGFDLVDEDEKDMHANGVPAARGWKLNAL